MSEDNGPALEGQSHGSFSETRAAHICSVIVLSLAVLSGLHLLWFLHRSVPRFYDMFRQMEISLPTTTWIVISPLFSALILLLVVGGVAKEFLVKQKLYALVANGILLFVVASLRTFVTAALYQPLLMLMEGL